MEFTASMRFREKIADDRDSCYDGSGKMYSGWATDFLEVRVKPRPIAVTDYTNFLKLIT